MYSSALDNVSLASHNSVRNKYLRWAPNSELYLAHVQNTALGYSLGYFGVIGALTQVLYL